MSEVYDTLLESTNSVLRYVEAYDTIADSEHGTIVLASVEAPTVLSIFVASPKDMDA